MILLTRFFYNILTIFLVVVAVLIGTGFEWQAFAKPITPEVAAQEINQADSPEEAGNRIRQQARDYKRELPDDANYTKEAAKTATKKTQAKLKQTADTLQKKLNLDQSTSQNSKNLVGFN